MFCRPLESTHTHTHEQTKKPNKHNTDTHTHLYVCTNLGEDDINQAKGPRPSDPSTAVDNPWSRVRAKTATVTNSIEILQEHIGILGDTKVRPVGVMEVHDHSRFIILKEEREMF